jgi:CheY-like chemotaxis protein
LSTVERPRILVVDDNDDVRSLLCQRLRALGKGTVVGEAANGVEAVAWAATLQPDLVLLDLSMPEMDGLQALPLIISVVDHVQVVVMSGFDQRMVADQALASGAVKYIEKGLRMDLGALIDELYHPARSGS